MDYFVYNRVVYASKSFDQRSISSKYPKFHWCTFESDVYEEIYQAVRRGIERSLETEYIVEEQQVIRVMEVDPIIIVSMIHNLSKKDLMKLFPDKIIHVYSPKEYKEIKEKMIDGIVKP